MRYTENVTNLGYDGNLRSLIRLARGDFCFFMGNDDLLCPGALGHVRGVAARHPDAGVLLRSYSWFQGLPTNVLGTVRYADTETELPRGPETIAAFVRRSGVLSGWTIRRSPAISLETDRYDGGLYYQMYLTGVVLGRFAAVCTPEVLVLCRDDTRPN